MKFKADSYFDAWRLTHDGPKSRNNETVEFISYSDGWRMTVRLTHDGSFDAPIRIEQCSTFLSEFDLRTSAYDNVQYSICSIVTFPPQYYPHFDARKLWIKRALRQTNRHASSEPSCVKRTVMRQPAVMRQPSCVKVWIGLKPITYNWFPERAMYYVLCT